MVYVENRCPFWIAIERLGDILGSVGQGWGGACLSLNAERWNGYKNVTCCSVFAAEDAVCLFYVCRYRSWISGLDLSAV